LSIIPLIKTLLIATLSALLPSAASAQSASEPALRNFTEIRQTSAQFSAVSKAVSLSGSPRLAGFVLTDPALSAPVRASGERLLARIGHGSDPMPGDGAISISPFLRYDPNMNGGFPEDHVMVGGFRFKIDEKDQAVEGLIAGVIISYGWRAGLGGRTALEVQSALSLGHGLEHDLKKVSSRAEGCIRHMARPDLYFHGCVDVGGARYDLGRSERAGARVAVSRILTGLDGVHELNLEGRVERALTPVEYERGILSASVISAMPGPVVWSGRAEWGQPVEGVLVSRTRLLLGATFELVGEPTSVLVDWNNSSGSVFLGVPREDQTLTLSFNRSVNRKVRLSAALTLNTSSIKPYNRKNIDLGISARY